MNSIDATLLMIGLFLLRLAVPIVMTLLFGLMMNRLLERSSFRVK